MNGIEGLPISGLRPYKEAHTYQRRTAATRSPFPNRKHTLKSAPAVRTAPTKSGESANQKMFGSACHSGLSDACSSTPFDENISLPHGSNLRKCCSRYPPRRMRYMEYCPLVHPFFTGRAPPETI